MELGKKDQLIPQYINFVELLWYRAVLHNNIPSCAPLFPVSDMALPYLTQKTDDPENRAGEVLHRSRQAGASQPRLCIIYQQGEQLNAVRISTPTHGNNASPFRRGKLTVLKRTGFEEPSSGGERRAL